jgi:2-polyprenyl-3-methyl-5-hydroxy-6-metoxy-1,4-benzoquinol methylase
MRVEQPMAWSRQFLDEIEEEMSPANGGLTADDRAALKRYYGGWFEGRYAAWRRASRWRYAARVAHALRWLSRFEKPHVLDAGSGLGTDSIIMGAAGARVLGLDLSLERVQVARVRAARRRERDPAMEVEFAARNIFDLTESGFSLIWVNEAISHIDPPERFFALCREHLAPGGALMIADPNAANPPNALLMYLRRGREVHIQKRDPNTGEMVSYAQERIFSLRRMCRMLTAAGLRVAQAESLYFVPTPLCPFAALFRAEEVLGRLPVLRHAGLAYIVAAVRD